MKASVRQNRYGNWYGYKGHKRVIEFALEPAFLVASDVTMPGTGNEMPAAAKAWLEQNKSIKQRLTVRPLELTQNGPQCGEQVKG